MGGGFGRQEKRGCQVTTHRIPASPAWTHVPILRRPDPPQTQTVPAVGVKTCPFCRHDMAETADGPRCLFCAAAKAGREADALRLKKIMAAGVLQVWRARPWWRKGGKT